MNEQRLIDANALKENFTEDLANGLWHFTGIWAVIEAAPTIDPVKHGMWKTVVKRDGKIADVCTSCDNALLSELGLYMYAKDMAYCPNCGAKMNEEETK